MKIYSKVILEKLRWVLFNSFNTTLTTSTNATLTEDYPVPPSIIDVSKTIALDALLYSDVQFDFDAENGIEFQSLMENWEKNLSISLTCSFTGSTTIAHTLGSYNGNSVPNWIGLDIANSLLKFTLPNVTVDTDFSFQIVSSFGTNNISYYKPVFLKVLNWLVDNCHLCDTNDTSVWNTWEDGYEISNNQWNQIATQESNQTSSESSNQTSSEVSNQTSSQISNQTSSQTSNQDNVNKQKLANQWLLGFAVFLALAISLFSLSSPTAVWSIINQLQLLILLLLTGAYIPDKVYNFLIGMEMLTLNLSFIPISDLPILSKFYDWMNFEQENAIYRDIGVKSGSSSLNNLALLLIIIIVIIFHTCL